MKSIEEYFSARLKVTGGYETDKRMRRCPSVDHCPWRKDLRVWTV